MLEDTLDPRPGHHEFAQQVAARAAERGYTTNDLARWLRGWHDREGAWATLRNLEHWVDRAGR